MPIIVLSPFNLWDFHGIGLVAVDDCKLIVLKLGGQPFKKLGDRHSMPYFYSISSYRSWLGMVRRLQLKLPYCVHKIFRMARMPHAVSFAFRAEQMALVAAHLLLTSMSVSICALVGLSAH